MGTTRHLIRSKELTETDVPKLLLFADKDVIQAVRLLPLARPLKLQDEMSPGLLRVVPWRSSDTDRACGRTS